MVVNFTPDIRFEVSVENKPSLFGWYSITKVRVSVNQSEDAAEFVWARDYRSDEELEIMDILGKLESLLLGGQKLLEQIEYSIAVISCAKDKVGSLIREGEMWDTAKLISSLLLGRFSTRSEAVQELERVRGRLLVDALEAQIR